MAEYIPIAETYRDFLISLIEQKKYVVVKYTNDIEGFYTKTAILKNISKNEKEEEFLVLITGEEIRLDRLKLVDGNLPPHVDPGFFACEC